VNHSGFYWHNRLWGGSGISWTICKSFAPRSRQLTTPVPHHSVFTGQMPFLPPNQQRQSTEDKLKILIYHPKFPLKVIHAFPQAIQTTTTAPLPTASISDSVTIANNARLKLQKFDNHYHKLTGILNLCHDFVTYRNKQVFIRRFNMNRTTEETA